MREFGTGIVLLLIVFAALTGAADWALQSVSIDANAVQLADALVGLATLCVAGLTWRAQRRATRLAAEPITLILRRGDDEVVFPSSPRRADCATRAELAGLLGSLQAERVNLGPAVLRTLRDPAYAAMMSGRSSRLVIAIDDPAVFDSLRESIAAL